jgi:hypothetical protein
MIQPSKYNQIFTLFAVLILTNNNLRRCCYRAKRHCWGGESCGLAKQGGRTSKTFTRVNHQKINFNIMKATRSLGRAAKPKKHFDSSLYLKPRNAFPKSSNRTPLLRG